MASDAQLVQFLLRCGDNALILGQRLSAWTGHAPILEEDLALTNVALDLVGQARLWLTYAGEVEGAGRDEDRLAYFRDSGDYRNVLLVEQKNGSYADTTARQFLFDAWHFHLLRALESSRDERVAAIARKAVREVAYHLRRSGAWVVRLGDGTDESRRRIQTAFEDLWPFTAELFVPDAIDDAMQRRSVGADLDALRVPWLAHVTRVLADATLVLPTSAHVVLGGKAGKHSEHLSYLLAEMQSVPRSVAAERW